MMYVGGPKYSTFYQKVMRMLLKSKQQGHYALKLAQKSGAPQLVQHFDGALNKPWEATCFTFPKSANDTLYELSNNHWNKWGPLVAPFRHTWIEWSTVVSRNLRVNPSEMVEHEGMMIVDDTAMFFCGYQDSAVVLPFMMGLKPHQIINKKTVDRMKGDVSSATQHLWGTNYEKVYGDGEFPPYPVVGPENIDGIYLTTEFSGIARYGAACLAFLNAPRATELVVAEPKKTMIGGSIRPYPKTNLVVIRPDGVRRVYQNSRQNTLSMGKRLHEVRQHLRRYKSGKIAIVRSHRRGNEELGVVSKEYIVEPTPLV